MILQGGPHRLNEEPASSPRCQHSSEREGAGMLTGQRQAAAPHFLCAEDEGRTHIRPFIPSREEAMG